MDQLARIIIQETEAIKKSVDLGELRGKTVILTGASGLVGTYFLSSLRQINKIKVIALIQSRPLNYWSQLADFKGCRVIQGDLTQINPYRHLPKADYIIHCAGYGQPGRFLAEPLQTLKLNTVCLFNLLEKLNTGGKFLFISSSEIYCPEEIGNPRFIYIAAKKAGEVICQVAKNQGVNVKICRLSLAYGPGTKRDDQRVLNQLIAKGLNGKVRLLDRGEAKRTYGYVIDSVEVMWQVLLKGKETVYDVAGESAVTIAGLAKKISGYLKVPLALPTKGKRMAGAPELVKVDTNKMKQEFNKYQFVSLNDGLKRTIEWQRLLYASSN